MANLETAERSVRSGDFRKAIIALAAEPFDVPIVRKLLLVSLHGVEDWDRVIDRFSGPQNEDEIAIVFDALVHRHRLDDADKLLEKCSTAGIGSPSLITELRKRLTAERKMGSIS